MGRLHSVERVAHFLIELSELQGLTEMTSGSMKLYLTRQEIGDYLGLTLETVSRAFSKLRDMRVIAVLGSDSVAIIDEERLRELTRR